MSILISILLGFHVRGSRWPTWLGRWHLLFGLQLHGFEPCKGHKQKMDIGVTPHRRWPNDPEQDVSGRPAHDS